MKFGVQLPEVERIVRWDELRRMAVLAEDVGFDSLWVGDHYLYGERPDRRGPWEVWTQLAAIAAVTTTVTIAPFVASLAFHRPAVLAKFASTVDEISGGRLVLGVGAGWNEVEFRAFGIPYDRRVDRFAEAFEIVRRLMRGETVTSAGEFGAIEDCVVLPASFRDGPVPLLIGSTGRRMLQIALPHVDAWNAWFTEYDNTPSKVPALLAEFDEACVRAGRAPAEIERSVAVLLDFGSDEPRQGSVNPIGGGHRRMADVLSEIAAAGVDHVQLVLDPIDEASIAAAADVVALVDRK